MSGSCVVDADAVLRFGVVALQVFRDICEMIDTAVDAGASIADLVPQSATAPQWCESARVALEIVRRTAECFRRLAEHTEQAVDVFAAADRHGAAALASVVRI
ncbi:hypothetical protein BJY24_003602 [Nocardia transvalensis]|uniref:Uncharacterized protein n=1 Tax=Nocardia transvalensis TaxID=37333 RepID=A0A7W9PET9_9NOCA|nr:hypothetical protein [Nocardia transvalensis]MBB5914735.1 hypothetical protein [Nocardia transvalensis]